MTVLPACSGIVLAGGRARRFGRDKLAEPVRGRPLVQHAVDAVAAVTTEVLVVVAPGSVSPVPPDAGGRVRVLEDPVAHGGPALGLRVALDHAREPLALVVGGDMPRLAVPVLTLLLRTLDAAEPGDVEAVALIHRGRRQPIPVALRVGAATVAAQQGASRGDASLSGVLRHLLVRDIDEPSWRPLDPEAVTLADVDRPEDLAALGEP